MSNIGLQQPRMTFFLLIDQANVSKVFIVVSHTEILRKFYVVPVQTFV